MLCTMGRCPLRSTVLKLLVRWKCFVGRDEVLSNKLGDNEKEEYKDHARRHKWGVLPSG